MTEDAKPKGKRGIRTGPKCGARNRQGKPCGHPSGYLTDHPGVGRCKFHGGASPIKHGRYSSIPRARLQKRIDELSADPNPLDLVPDLQLARACLLEFIEGKRGFDPGTAAELLERISRIAQRIHDMQEQKSVGVDQLRWIMAQMALVVSEHVKDVDTLRAIESGWGAIVCK